MAVSGSLDAAVPGSLAALNCASSYSTCSSSGGQVALTSRASCESCAMKRLAPNPERKASSSLIARLASRSDACMDCCASRAAAASRASRTSRGRSDSHERTAFSAPSARVSDARALAASVARSAALMPDRAAPADAAELDGDESGIWCTSFSSSASASRAPPWGAAIFSSVTARSRSATQVPVRASAARARREDRRASPHH
mmetsp:Transcript_24065/g.55371  ORF Transcript_24065/g.55371 Transcript_24065/m.55371 type:complete len:202 (-) Transcript_24065:18-623(-)